MNIDRFFLVIICFFALFCINNAIDSSDLVIYKISNSPVDGQGDRVSSLGGGLTFYVKGSGFDLVASNNLVFIGPYQANVLGVNDVFLIFESMSIDHECDLFVNIFVINTQTQIKTTALCLDNCFINYRWFRTTELYQIKPRSAAPNEYINFYGNMKFDSTSHIDSIKMGPFICDRVGLDDLDISPGTNLISCRVAIELVAGQYSADLKVASSGYSTKYQTFCGIDSLDNLYDFRCIPQIRSVSSNIGSPKGQILTIKGFGFSSNITSLQVIAGDYPCIVLTADTYTITCKVSQTALNQTIYFKGSGIERWVYNGYSDISNQQFAKAFWNNSVTAPLLSYSIYNSLDRPPVDQNVEMNIVEAWKAYFRAPENGQYRFYLAADDYAELWLSNTTNSSNPANLNKIAYYYSYTPYARSDYNDSLRSSTITLQKGAYYLLNAFRNQATSTSHMWVGVEVPHNAYTSLKIDSLQRINITYNPTREVMELKVNNYNNISQFKITVVVKDPLTGNQLYYAETQSLNYNISSNDLISRLYYDLGWGWTQIIRVPIDSSGNIITNLTISNTGYKYIITFTSYRNPIQGRQIQPTIKKLNSNDFSVSITIGTTVPPSPPIGGIVTLDIGFNGIVIQMPGNATDITPYFNTIPGLTKNFFCETRGNSLENHYYLIRFAGINVTKAMTIKNNGLTGGQNTPLVVINELMTGSNNIFYDPLPNEFLFTTSSIPHVTVTSDGILGKCNAKNCSYIVDIRIAPQLDNFTVTANGLQLVLSNYQNITINVSTIDIIFAGSDCLPTSVSLPVVYCAINKNTDSSLKIEAGSYLPLVHFDSIGYSTYATGLQNFTVPLNFKAIDNTSGGSSSGGQILTITGTGYPLSSSSDNTVSVTIGGSICEILIISNQRLVIRTPAKNSATPNLIISMNGLTTTPYNYIYSDAATPLIASLTPLTSSPSQKAYIKISGSNFGVNLANIQAYLVNSTNSSIFYQLSLINITNTDIWAILGGGRIGQYYLKLLVQGVGYSSESIVGSSIFSYDLSITGISPVIGSIYGGTIITFTGNNFSPITNQNQIFIGDVINNMCDIISSNATTLICQTRFAPLECLGSSQTTLITQRVQDEAICKTSNGCKFTFQASRSPEITSNTTITALAGDKVILNGTKLSPDPNGFVWILFINGTSRTETFQLNLTVKADIFTDTQVIFTMPALREGVYNIKVLVDNKGWASLPRGFNITTPIIVFGVIFNDSSLNITRTGSKGGLMMTLVGNGFYNETIYIDPSTYGIIYSINRTAITFSTGPLSGFGTYAIGVFRSSTMKYTCVNCSITTTTAKTITLTNHNAIGNMWSTFTLQGTGSNLNMTNQSIIARLDVLDSKNIFLKDSFIGTVATVNATFITVNFANIPMGVYALNLFYSETGFAYINSNKLITIISSGLKGSANITTSYMGGNTLKITGLGFPKDWSIISKTNISICGSLCTVSASDSSSVSCNIPPLLTKSALNNYNLFDSANNQQTNYDIYSDNPVLQRYINDNKLNTFYDSVNVNTCYVTYDFGSNFMLNLTQIQYYPALTKPLSYFYGLKFQASNDNITYNELFSMDQNMKTGWNTWSSNSSLSPYRYIKIAPNSTQKLSRCNIAEVKFYGQLLYSGSSTLASTVCSPVVQLNGSLFTLNTTVAYTTANTPVVQTMSPVLGPTIGGTIVTITGTGFGSNTSLVSVIMDGVACKVSTVTSTTITCITQARPLFVDSFTLITVNGNNAIFSIDPYIYIDRWSDARTWGGESPPRSGDSVYIPSGQNVLLDVSTPILNTVIVEGTLIFEDGTDKTFDAYYLICMQGRVQIGTYPKPFNSKLTITMHGRKWYPKQLPEYGNKVWAFHQGVLDMHGKPKKYTWTVLSKTAEAGDKIIYLNDTVDWSVNDKIAIASTDFNHNHSEYRSITAINSKTLTLDLPLQYRHYSQIETYGTTRFPMQAEVAMLSRNIVFQGSTDEVTDTDKYGAHMMFHMQGAIGRISYTEFTNVGQGFIIGRYPMHYHMIDDASDSFCIGNAVHHSWARVVAIHDSHFLTVQRNVGYRIYGHNFFIEDGIETNNLFEDNLGISTVQIWTLINTDVTAATYWITNPNNIVRRNRAAGGDWFGFWFKLENRVTGPSSNPNICPDGVPLGEFSNNLAHSYFQGLRITEYVPRQYPCVLYDDDSSFQSNAWFLKNPSIHVIFSDFIAYKNFEYGLYADVIGSIEFKNFLVAESRLSGIHISQTNFTGEDQALVNGAIIVGLCQNNTDDDVSRYQRSIGFTTPRTDFLLVNNVTFYNFSSNYNMSAFLSCAVCWHPKLTITGGKTTKFSKLSFNNVDRKIIWQGLEKEIYNDLDGSFAGTGQAGWITKFYPHLGNINECSALNVSIYDDSIYCKGAIQVRSIMFRNPIPNEMYRGLEIRVVRIPDINYNISLAKDSDFTRVPMYKIFVDTKYTWDLCFVTGYIYNVHWQNGNLDWTHMNFYPTPVWKPSDKGIVLRFNYTDYKEDYLVQVHKWGGTVLNATRYNETNTTLDPVIDNYTLGDYILQNKTELLLLGINGKQNGTVDIDTVICRLYCPVINNNSVISDNFTRLWSNASMWPNQKLPATGDIVNILPEWRVKLDIDPPALDKLVIDGELLFDSSRALSKLSANNIWIRKGNMTAGNASVPFPGQIIINMTGTRSTDAFIIDSSYSVGANSIIVTGSMRLYGKNKTITWTKLSMIGNIGDSSIQLVDNVDWQVGDLIVIAPTETDPLAYETKTIKAITSLNTLVLDTPLENFHYGDGSITYTAKFGGVLDMRAGVGLLSRNIKITSNPVNNWGVNILVYQLSDTDANLTLRGYAEMQGVEISYGGHPDTERGSFDIKYIQKAGPQTIFRNSSIYNGIGWCYNSYSSQNMTIENNVFFNCEKFLTRALFTTNFTFKSNLLIAPRKRNLPDSGLYDMVAGLDMYQGFAPNKGSNILITQNLVQGGGGNGFVLPGQVCGEKNIAFYNNQAQSMTYAGLILYQNNSNCFELTDFSAATSLSGVLSNFNGPGLNIQRMILAENVVNTRIWLGHESDDITLRFIDIDYLALVRPNCVKCYMKETCSNRIALLIPIVQIAGKSIPIDKSHPEGIISQCTDSAFDSKLVMTNINFINYKLSYTSDANINYRNCSNNIIFDQGAVPDQSSRIYISNGYAKNSESESFFSLQEPPQQFLFWRGGCGDFNCSGNKNWILNDLDGKLTGQIGQVVPKNLGINNTNCIDRNTWNAKFCSGITFGMLEFQNDGPDQRLRIIAPVNATSSIGKITLNQWREWKWLGPDPLDKRLARFNGMIQVNSTMNLEFEVVVPEELKLKLENYGDFWYSVITIRYERPNVIEVWNLNKNLFMKPYRKDQNIDLSSLAIDANNCGLNIYDPETSTIQFILNNRGDCVLKVRTIDAVRITMHLEVSIEDFFKNSGETAFIDKISTFLHIDMSTIRIAKILAGSTYVNYFIVDNKPLGNSTSALDSNVSNYTNETTPDQIASYNNLLGVLQGYSDLLQNGVNNGSLKILNGSVLGMTSQLIVKNLASNNSTDTNTVTLLDGDNSKILVILLATLIPGITILVLCVFCYLKYKEGFSLMKMAFNFSRSNKTGEISFNQELIGQSQQKNKDSGKWKDPEEPFDDRKNNKKNIVQNIKETEKYMKNKN